MTLVKITSDILQIRRPVEINCKVSQEIRCTLESNFPLKSRIIRELGSFNTPDVYKRHSSLTLKRFSVPACPQNNFML